MTQLYKVEIDHRKLGTKGTERLQKSSFTVTKDQLKDMDVIVEEVKFFLSNFGFDMRKVNKDVITIEVLKEIDNGLQ